MAETFDEVISLLMNAGYWDNEDVWRDYGNISVNFSSVGNQQSQAESALVEKLINSIDALLLRECHRKGINPNDPEKAPKTIKEAVEIFFDIPRGNLASLSTSQKVSLAENISLVATGEKEHPSIIVIDKGEGQLPSKFPETLVSLNQENKVKIPFVQGKFNMGSTGALQFCGPYGLQLIVSKRDPEIVNAAEDDPNASDWGFTIVRRFRPKGGMKTSVFRYLAPNGSVLTCNGAPLPILPGKYPSAYEKRLEWGTIIKMYEYDLKSKTNILLAPSFHFSLLLPDAALPIRFYERRKGFKGRGWEKTLTGIKVQLDEASALEPGYPKDRAISINGTALPCTLYVFRREMKKESGHESRKKINSPYLRSERILFTINGQTHGWLEKAFFRRKSVRLSSYLVDFVLIVVNCTELPREISEDLFMNSRDRLRHNEYRDQIESQLATMIHEDKELRELGLRRRQQELDSKLGDEKPLEDVLRSILEKAPSIARIFSKGSKLKRPFDTREVQEQILYTGQFFPSFFDLKSAPYRIATSRRIFVEYQTDAEDNYFGREDKPGKFQLHLEEGTPKFTWSLSSGRFSLGIDLPDDVIEGTTYHFTSKVTDYFRDDDSDSDSPFIDSFTIEVGKIQVHKPGGKSKHRGRSDKEGSDKETSDGITIPKVKEVFEEDWGDEFNRFSALVVKDDGMGNYDFYVNMDNIYLLQDIKRISGVDATILRAQFKYGLVLSSLAFLQDESEEDDRGIDSLNLISKITKKLAPMILPMIHELGDLIIEEI